MAKTWCNDGMDGMGRIQIISIMQFQFHPVGERDMGRVGRVVEKGT
jgi:hypothetical protein